MDYFPVQKSSRERRASWLTLFKEKKPFIPGESEVQFILVSISMSCTRMGIVGFGTKSKVSEVMSSFHSGVFKSDGDGSGVSGSEFEKRFALFCFSLKWWVQWGMSAFMNSFLSLVSSTYTSQEHCNTWEQKHREWNEWKNKVDGSSDMLWIADRCVDELRCLCADLPTQAKSGHPGSCCFLPRSCRVCWYILFHRGAHRHGTNRLHPLRTAYVFRPTKPEVAQQRSLCPVQWTRLSSSVLPLSSSWISSFYRGPESFSKTEFKHPWPSWKHHCGFCGSKDICRAKRMARGVWIQSSKSFQDRKRISKKMIKGDWGVPWTGQSDLCWATSGFVGRKTYAVRRGCRRLVPMGAPVEKNISAHPAGARKKATRTRVSGLGLCGQISAETTQLIDTPIRNSKHITWSIHFILSFISLSVFLFSSIAMFLAGVGGWNQRQKRVHESAHSSLNPSFQRKAKQCKPLLKLTSRNARSVAIWLEHSTVERAHDFTHLRLRTKPYNSHSCTGHGDGDENELNFRFAWNEWLFLFEQCQSTRSSFPWTFLYWEIIHFIPFFCCWLFGGWGCPKLKENSRCTGWLLHVEVEFVFFCVPCLILLQIKKILHHFIHPSQRFLFSLKSARSLQSLTASHSEQEQVQSPRRRPFLMWSVSLRSRLGKVSLFCTALFCSARFIFCLSWGGVGKSTIAINLAISLARKKQAVGILDAGISFIRPLLFHFWYALKTSMDHPSLDCWEFLEEQMSMTDLKYVHSFFTHFSSASLHNSFSLSQWQDTVSRPCQWYLFFLGYRFAPTF